MINNNLWLDHIHWHLEEDRTTCYAPISDFISVHKLIVVRLKEGVAGAFHVVFKDEINGTAELTKMHFYWLTRPRFLATLGSIALTFMSVDVVMENDLYSMNHPEEVRTWSMVT